MPGPALSRKQIPKTNENDPLEATLRAAPKKVLDSGSDLRETGNPPLDGTGSLKTEQRRTCEGRCKSKSRRGLRDSFEELVRRDGLGSTGRWLDDLQEDALPREAFGPSADASFKLFLESLILAQSERWRRA